MGMGTEIRHGFGKLPILPQRPLTNSIKVMEVFGVIFKQTPAGIGGLPTTLGTSEPRALTPQGVEALTMGTTKQGQL